MRNRHTGILTWLLVLCSLSLGYAQNLGINATNAAPHSSAILDVASTDKGILIPRMDSIARINILNPAQGLMVFDSTYNSFWYYNGLAWTPMMAVDEQQLSLLNDSLFLTNDPSPVDLTGYRQNLSLVNDTLHLSNDTSFADLTPYNDTLGDHIATQNLQLNGHWINNDGDANEGIYIDTAGQVGINHDGVIDGLLQIGKAPGAVYKFKEDGFVINEYTLPLTAGNVNEVLTTDGNGNVSWVNPATQGLGDSLGNHIATQNISSEGYWINNDGTPFTGVYLDTFGRMGVNITPQANFHVFMGTATDTSEFAGFSSSEETFGPLFPYQSFTCPETGFFEEMILTFGTMNAGRTVQLVEGEGYGGTVLFSSSVAVGSHPGVRDFAIPNNSGQNILLEAGKVYSILCYRCGAWQLVDGNGYAGGQSTDPNKDHGFKVRGKVAYPGFMVTDTTVTFNGYSFPITDGMVDEALVTDGAGNLSWMPVGGGTNQQLTLANDTLTLTDGGAPISLSPYQEVPDHLGNHTATQNFLLGTHKLQFNDSRGPNVGVALGTSNELSVISNLQRPARFECNYYEPIIGIGAYMEVSNEEGTRALFGPDGFGFNGGSPANVIMANWSAGGMQLMTQGVQRMYIDASGKVGIGRVAATNLLEVEGNASKSAAGDWLANSDQRLKKNIQALDSREMLDKLLSLQGVTYEWDDQQTGTQRPEGLQYGFTAQNIQENFPSLVSEDQHGYLQTAYGTLDAMSLEAIEGLKDKVVQLRERNTQLKAHLEEVAAWNAELDAVEPTTTGTSNKKSPDHN